ncbi:MAG: signal peptide peptidase SppA [Calditrichia bacterium]
MRFVLLLLFVLTSILPVAAQDFVSAYERNQFLMGSSTSFQEGLLGFANPANAAQLQRFSGRFHWSTDEDEGLSFRNWGMFTGAKGIGFAAQSQKFGGVAVRDYQLSMAGGNSASAFGIGYSWAGGAKNAFNREKLFSLGWLVRPAKYLSLGFTGSLSTETSAREGFFEAGIRPLGNSRLTLFGDLAMQKRTRLDEAPWSAGAAVEVLPGLNITGRYFDSEAFTVGISITSGFGRIATQGHFDTQQEYSFSSYSFGFGDYAPDFYEKILPGPPKYLKMEMKGRVKYLGYRLGDGGQRFWEVIEDIRKARENPTIKGFALNLSGLRVLPEHAWEIREELRLAKEAGKKIAVFLDNGNMTTYHLASIADVVMLDPEGSLMLPGYIMGRTYMKGTLEKLGLGFDEWRFFKYKSAAESLSRDKLSEADAEQRKALLEDWYSIFRNEVLAERPAAADSFEAVINQEVYVVPDRALATQLVDTLGRWNGISKMMEKLIGPSAPILKDELYARDESRPDWGPTPKIALVYALGACAMDSGIRARWLEKTLLRLEKNPHVKAVVLRVDSPGGDGMASDYVAEAVKKITEKKPVLISQGQVAASGGYWISMYGSKIFAAPGTITGSIGVIGGWVYDKGVTDKLGMTSDHVKIGEHADLGFGVRLPILGITVPRRNLSEYERAKMETFIRGFYQTFLKKVAVGREMEVDAVHEIAQGRVWSGIDGKENGLIDEVGGLRAAIASARELAGILPDEKVDIVEVPSSLGLFDAKVLNPLPISLSLEEDATLNFIRMITEKQGRPLPLLLPGMYPTLDD